MIPHFSGTIELGQILTILTMIGIAIRVLTALEGFEMEHEMLIDDYCERKGLKRTDLLTRRRKSVLAILFTGGRRD